jgi:hypothetical protein
MKPKFKKNQMVEEPVEAKPGNTAAEPTSFKAETASLVKGLMKSGWEDMLGASPKTFSEQIMGSSDKSKDLVEGQEISLNNSQAEKPKITAEHLSYVRTTIERADSLGDDKVETEMRRSMDEIRAEIQKLVKTSKVVERTVKDASVDKTPVRPGKYHLSFFEFVLSVVKDATRKLEDTVHFGAIFTSKKKQRQYWSMYKKKGTTFGLSGERVVSTQTG